MRRRVDVVAEHGSVALANSIEHNNLFLMPLWRTIGKSKWMVAARTLPKTIAIAVVALAALLSLFFIPAEFQLHGKGTLEPVVKRDVFADVDGIVTKVLVKQGDEVKVGQPLIEMRDTTLNISTEEVVGKLAANASLIESLQRSLSRDRTSSDERSHLEEQLVQAQAQQPELQAQVDLYKQKKDMLTVRSPIDGKVITWQLEERLINRPVEKSQVLLTVVDPTKNWELEVHMPEDRMGHIKHAQQKMGDALDVSYQLKYDPGHTLHGKIKEVHEAAEVQGDEGNTVLVRVAIDSKDIGPEGRPGSEVSAKIDCGRRSLGYVWLHDVFEFVQSKILFRL